MREILDAFLRDFTEKTDSKSPALRFAAVGMTTFA